MLRETLILGMVLLCSSVQPGWAMEDDAMQVKADFNKIVLQRNQLASKLRQLDARAVEQLKAGHDTTTLNAEQITVQDRLDLIQLRLETSAARYGLIIPPVPEEREAIGQAVADLHAVSGTDAFARGYQRTLMQLRREALDWLASLDFSSVRQKIGD